MKCLVCDDEILYRERSSKKYCSAICRNKFQEIEKRKYEKTCLNCNELYLGKEKQKYCTHHCSTRPKKNNLSEALRYYNHIHHEDDENRDYTPPYSGEMYKDWL